MEFLYFITALKSLAVLRQVLWRTELTLEALPIIQLDRAVTFARPLHRNRASEMLRRYLFAWVADRRST